MNTRNAERIMKISARLLPAVEINGTWISIEPTSALDGMGKPRWRWFVDLANGKEHSGDDLTGWGNAGEMMGSLLSFLAACAESYPDGDCADLFPAEVAEWAQQESDGIGMMAFDLEED